MAIKTRNRHLTKFVKWTENGSDIVDIPQDNPIRRIKLHGKIKVTTGATAGTGIKNGGLLNLVKRIQVRLNGHDSIFDIDLKSYFAALTFEYGCKPFISTFAIPAASTNATFDFEVPIDFALIRNQISDFGALLPAHLLDSVELLIDFGDITDLLTTKATTVITEAGSKIALSIIEVYATESAAELEDIMKNLTKVYEGIEQTEIDGSHNSYPADELPIQVRPVPARHLAACLFGLKNITDGNPAYSNDVVSQIKIENVKGGGEFFFHEYFENLQREQKLDFRFENDNSVGIVYLDYGDIRNGSLDNVDVDAIKFKILTAAPAANKKNALRIYKKYIPVSQ